MLYLHCLIGPWPVVFCRIRTVSGEAALNRVSFMRLPVLTLDCRAGGGVGSSSLAAACALNFAARGRSVLYLNLEKFGGSSQFFSGEGQFDMSDVVLSLKSRKANLALKLESYVRRDPRGVFFFASQSAPRCSR